MGTPTNIVDPDAATLKYLLSCQRRDPGMSWVQFYVTNKTQFATNYEALAPIYFGPEDNVAQTEYIQLIRAGGGPTNDVGCTVGTFYDQVSTSRTPISFTIGPDTNQQFEAD